MQAGLSEKPSEEVNTREIKTDDRSDWPHCHGITSSIADGNAGANPERDLAPGGWRRLDLRNNSGWEEDDYGLRCPRQGGRGRQTRILGGGSHVRCAAERRCHRQSA